MPHLDIAGGALDTLFNAYHKLWPEQGYLCDGAKIHIDRLERFIAALSSVEQKEMKSASNHFDTLMRDLNRQNGHEVSDDGMFRSLRWFLILFD